MLSNDLTGFFVVADVPDPPPNRPMVLSADSRSVNLSWAPPRKVHNHPVSAYKIFIKSVLLNNEDLFFPATFLNIFAELVFLVQRYSRRDQTAPLVLTKSTNLTKTFKKVAGKNKWHYSCYIVILIAK